MLKNLNSILTKFNPISLDQMDSVKLLNRTDTKFIFNSAVLHDFLSSCYNNYNILTIDNKKIASYKTLYFDTKYFDFYHHHHNNKGNRYKVRIRKYVDSNLCFLEVKNKIKGRTVKSRKAIEDFENTLSVGSLEFVGSVMNSSKPLEKKIWNSFDRITLTNQKLKERLTIDLNLSFEQNGQQKLLNDIVICELKQERVNRSSPAFRILKNLQIRPSRISKYCIGSGSLNHHLKRNRFKKKFLQLDKIKSQLN